MTAGMSAPLLLLLSGAVLRSVSAGGLYCAKTARARAAAMGLDFPGVRGAPDFSGPARRGMHSTAMTSPPLYYDDPELAETEPNMANYRHKQPPVSSLVDRKYKQAGFEPTPLLLSHGTYGPVQAEHGAERVIGFPRGRLVSNRKSNFEGVKHVAPPTWTEAWGNSDLVNGDPEGLNRPLSFVYSEHDLVDDESVPNRRGISLSGRPMFHSRGHGAYQRGPGLTGYRLGREVPVLGSSSFSSHASAAMNRNAAMSRMRSIMFPRPLSQSLHRGFNVKRFVHGLPVLRGLIKPPSGPSRAN